MILKKSSYNEEHLNVSFVYQSVYFSKNWPTQNETWCTRQTRPCSYICYIKIKI